MRNTYTSERKNFKIYAYSKQVYEATVQESDSGRECRIRVADPMRKRRGLYSPWRATPRQALDAIGPLIDVAPVQAVLIEDNANDTRARWSS